MLEREIPKWDDYWLQLLPVIKSRSACAKRQVGAVIVSTEMNIISTGYNGQPRGVQNCIGELCNGIRFRGTPDGKCETVHAEVNAIYHAGDRIRLAGTMYLTTEPCIDCALLIKQTPITRVLFVDHHSDKRGSVFLRRHNIQVAQHGIGGRAPEND
jgi:dCMP deaminase